MTRIKVAQFASIRWCFAYLSGRAYVEFKNGQRVSGFRRIGGGDVIVKVTNLKESE